MNVGIGGCTPPQPRYSTLRYPKLRSCAPDNLLLAAMIQFEMIMFRFMKPEQLAGPPSAH